MIKQTIRWPCKRCICLAICRHKNYGDLFNDCYPLSKFFNNRLKQHYSWELDTNLLHCLKSTGWELLGFTTRNI